VNGVARSAMQNRCMKRRCSRWLAVLALCALAPHALAEVLDCDIAGQSVNPNNGATTAGKTGLMRCVDRDSRVLALEEEWRDGRSVGVKRWYEQGRLKREYSVNDVGNRDGREREWNAQGQLVREGFQANSASVGLHRTWHDNGRLKSAAHWGEPGDERRSEPWSRIDFNAQGQLTDLSCGPRPRLDDEAQRCGHQGKAVLTELFTERGQLAQRVTYERGQLLRQEQYWDDGKPRFVEERQGSHRIARQFSRDGVKRKETVREDGRRVLEQDFSDRGTLVNEKRWRADGELESESEWYLNGQPRQVTSFENAMRVERMFHDNGKPSSEGRWRMQGRGRDLPVGAHQSFDSTGRLRAETLFDDKGRPTRERTWDESGRALSDDEVYEDGSRKAVGTTR
jgi:antitoxin component YwqK of YwqJK toxin-antitoxin module